MRKAFSGDQDMNCEMTSAQTVQLTIIYELGEATTEPGGC